MVAVPGDSRTTFQSGFGLRDPALKRSTYMRSMLETPWVLTPLRSAVTSTSAPSDASSEETAIFEKMAVTAWRSDPSATRTSSFSGP